MSNEKAVNEVDLSKVFSLNGANSKVVLAVVN